MKWPTFLRKSIPRVRVPNFFCIGAQKSGTTWLYEQLSRHPEVSIPVKEMKTFHEDRPLKWYAKKYRESVGAKVIGDISPSYAVWENVSEHIYKISPDARIVMLVREPGSRAYSQWKMATRLGNIPEELSFIEAWRQDRKWLKRRGEYIETIEEFIRLFPFERQFRVYFFEEVKEQPGDLLGRICDYLEIDSGWVSPVTDQVYGKARDDRRLSDEDAEEVRAHYLPYNERLGDFLGGDLPAWLRSS